MGPYIQELLDPHCISVSSRFSLYPVIPEFPTAIDPFKSLGPPETFSAKLHWEPPREIRLVKQGGSLGFSLRGERPPIISRVEDGSTAKVK